nr:MAG TPA: hypothetical protein [Caudoviricetes sp.]
MPTSTDPNLYPDLGYRLSARKTMPYMRPLYLKGPHS